MKRLTTLAALLLTGYCSTASAAMIYAESVDGDFSAIGSALTTLNLSPGISTVSGTSTRFPFDLDSFAFIVPIGVTLTNITWTGVFSGSMTGATWSLRSGSASSGGGILMQSIGSSGPSSLIPMSAETYNLTASGPTGTSNTAGAVDYTFTFTLEPTAGAEVPEPGSFVLLGMGMAGMYLIRKRR